MTSCSQLNTCSSRNACIHRITTPLVLLCPCLVLSSHSNWFNHIPSNVRWNDARIRDFVVLLWYFVGCCDVAVFYERLLYANHQQMGDCNMASTKTFVYNGTEVRQTGRVAVRQLSHKAVELYEVTAVGEFSAGTWWAPPSELYVITTASPAPHQLSNTHDE